MVNRICGYNPPMKLSSAVFQVIDLKLSHLKAVAAYKNGAPTLLKQFPDTYKYLCKKCTRKPKK